MKVFFIRHGESMANAKKIKSSNFDHLNDLTADGIVQIQETSTKIPEKISCIYASPYKRTVASAKIFIENRSEKLKLQVDDRLREINYGEYQDDLGNPEMDRITRKQVAGDYEIRFGKGENKREIITRFFSFLLNAFEKNANQNIVVFSHGRAISIIEYEFCMIRNIEKEHIHTGNGTIKKLDIDNSVVQVLKKHLQTLNKN